MTNDLVSRSALIAALENEKIRIAIDKVKMFGLIEAAPAVDAVEVVRCKDCRRFGMYCFGASSEERLACLEIEEDGFIRIASAVDPDDFCSHGERRRDGT